MTTTVEREDGDRFLFTPQGPDWQQQLQAIVLIEPMMLFQIVKKQVVLVIEALPSYLYCYSKQAFLKLTMSLPNGPDLRLQIYHTAATTSRNQNGDDKKLSVFYEVDPAQLDIYEVENARTVQQILRVVQPLAKKQGFAWKVADTYGDQFARVKCAYPFKDCHVFLCYRLGQEGCCFSGQLLHNHELGAKALQ